MMVVATGTEQRVIEIIVQLSEENLNRTEGFMSCLLMQQNMEELQKKQQQTAAQA